MTIPQKMIEQPMKAVFLSDAHLKQASDPSYRALMTFLGRLQRQESGTGQKALPQEGTPFDIPVTDLFLVGDVFDLWFSRNGRIYPEYEAVVRQLQALQAQGIAVHCFEGNHDFFMKGYFSDLLGMTVYEDWATIERDGRRIYVAHGDLVDRSNIGYLTLRRVLRNRLMFRIQRLLPLSFLWGVARFSSSLSKEFASGAESRIYGIMRQFAEDKFREGYDAVILGHCHTAKLEEFLVGGKTKYFAALGDWTRHCSYLYYDGGRFVLGNQK